MNNTVIGLSKTSSCVPLIWLAGAFIVYESLEKTQSYYLCPSPSCLTATLNGLQLAVANNKQIVVMHGEKLEIQTNGVVKDLFYSGNGSFLLAVQDDGISVYNGLEKLITFIPSSKVISIDFDQNEEYLITATRDLIQLWDVKAFRSQEALKKYSLLNTLRLDSIVKNSHIIKVVWSGYGMRLIHLVTNTGMLLVIKENLWVDRWVDVKMSNVSCILCTQDYVIVGGSFTRIFELDSLTYKATFKRHEAVNKIRPEVLSLHLVKENVVAIIYSNHNIDFWDISDVSNLKLVKRRNDHSGSILSVNCSSDNSILTNSKDGALCLWDVENQDNQTLINLRKKTVLSTTKKSVTSESVVEISGIHGLISYGDNDGLIILLKETDLTEELKFDSHNSGIKMIKFSEDSQERCIFVCVYSDLTLKIFEYNSGLKLIQTIPNAHMDIISLCFCQNGQKLVTASRNRLVFRKYNGESILEEFLSLELLDPICDISYDSRRDQLLCTSENRKISFLSLIDGNILHSFDWDSLGDSIIFWKMKLNLFKSMAAISCSDNSILLIDLNTGNKVNRLFGHSGKVLGLEFTKDGNLLFSCGEDGILVAWKIIESLISRSFSESMLSTLSMDFPSEYFPAWARKHSKSEVPIVNRDIAPQGRWAQRISSEGIRLFSDNDLATAPVASFHNRNKKRLSAELSSKNTDDTSRQSENDIVESLQFDVVQRDKWDFSKNIKLINQSERSPSDLIIEDERMSSAILKSLDLADSNSYSRPIEKAGDVETAGLIRSKSDLSELKYINENQRGGLEAVGIRIKGETDDVVITPSINVGEVEDDDEIQNLLQPSEVPPKMNLYATEEKLNDRKRERHATLGFVEAMVQQLETLRRSDTQNTGKISEIESELSKIGDIVKDALGRR